MREDGHLMNRLRVLTVAHRRDLERELDRLGVESIQARTIAAKGLARAVLVSSIDPREANILRREMLSLGAEAVLPRTSGVKKPIDTVLLATMQQYHRLVDRLVAQPGALPQLGGEIAQLLKDWEGPKRLALQAGDHFLSIGTHTYVMGIINITSDSFSGDGLLGSTGAAVERAKLFAAEGAHIIDVGGESARADVPVVDVRDEIRRVVPVVKAIVAETGLPVSIDTYKPQVAEAAVKAGASIINDIGGLKLGTGTAEVAAKTGAALVINHTYERPKVRPASPPLYPDLIDVVYSFLRERLAVVRGLGLPDDRVILDPGIAFGKSHDEDLTIVRRLREFEGLRRPLLVAPSRKNFIGSVLGAPVEDRLAGTAAVIALAIANGADIVRVHDVAAMAQVAKMADAITRRGAGDFAPSVDTWPAPAAVEGKAG
jgi:dihydropteroate synthase